MKQKIALKGIEARKKITEGVQFIGDIIKSTMGPHGENFLLEKGQKSTNDGKAIAMELMHTDPHAQKGLQEIRKAGINTEQEVKDASSTAIVLASEIYMEAIRHRPNEKVLIPKYSTGELLRKISAETKEVSNKLDAMATPIETLEQLIDVATVSTEDRELGRIIAEAQWELGPDGYVIADEHIADHIEVERVTGILIDNGMAMPTVSVNNFEKGTLDLKNIPIFMTSNTLKSLKDIEPLIKELIANRKHDVVFMARAYTEEAIKDIQTYSSKGMHIYPVQIPYTDMGEISKDLEAVLGGRYLSYEDEGIENLRIKDAGYVKNMSVGRFSAVYTGEDTDEAKVRVAKRIEVLEEKLKGKVSKFEAENISKRIAQMRNGFAIVKIGAETEIERKRLKDKADDAVGTVRMALKGGVVAGGGKALKEIADTLPDDYIIKEPLKAIYNHIMSTAPEGFEIEEWVKDPVITLKTALKFASEQAKNLAISGGVDATEKDPVRYVQEINRNESEE